MWAAGEKWHYAPMAAHLAQLGIVACVIQYTLYPDALVPQMVTEVSQAFTWVLDHVHKYGGDVKRVRGNSTEIFRAYGTYCYGISRNIILIAQNL